MSKNIKNDLPTTDINKCNYNAATQKGNKCKFLPNPIKHYRKQYTNSDNINTGYSRYSYIETLNKPGGSITTTNININDLSCNELNQIAYNYILNLKNIHCISNCLLIKPATTVIDNSYCVSNKELLQKKCKTYNQNLPSTNCNNDEICNNMDNIICRGPIFSPSNKKYQVQGAISSSSRTASLKYSDEDLLHCSNNNLQTKKYCCKYKFSNIRKF